MNTESWAGPRLSKAFIYNEVIMRVILVTLILCASYIPDLFYREIISEYWYSYSYTYSEEQFPMLETVLICGVTFIAVVVLSVLANIFIFHEKKKFVIRDLILLILGFSLACLVCLAIVQYIKMLVGRVRPCFLSYCTGTSSTFIWDVIPKYDMTDLDWNCCDRVLLVDDKPVCMPESYSVGNCNFVQSRTVFPKIPDCSRLIQDANKVSSLMAAAGNQHVLFKTDQYKHDDHELEDMRKSFPSGHSAMTFVSFTFMGLYVARVFSTRQGYWRNTMWFSVLCLFLVFPVTCAISRSRDYRHHVEDIFVGSLLGIICAIVAFRIYYNIYDMVPEAMSDFLLVEHEGYNNAAKDPRLSPWGAGESSHSINPVNNTSNNDTSC